jgi:hypothetical protein
MMSRSHTLLRFKKAEYVLAKVLTELKACEKSDQDYLLDMSFDREAHDLLNRYGYSVHQAIALISRHEAVKEMIKTCPEGELAKIYGQALQGQQPYDPKPSEEIG